MLDVGRFLLPALTLQSLMLQRFNVSALQRARLER